MNKLEKDFHRVIIRKVGVDFEVTNGHITVKGTNREELLRMVDLWEAAKRKEMKRRKRSP